jgi:hypothetical protein
MLYTDYDQMCTIITVQKKYFIDERFYVTIARSVEVVRHKTTRVQ